MAPQQVAAVFGLADLAATLRACRSGRYRSLLGPALLTAPAISAMLRHQPHQNHTHAAQDRTCRASGHRSAHHAGQFSVLRQQCNPVPGRHAGDAVASGVGSGKMGDRLCDWISHYGNRGHVGLATLAGKQASLRRALACRGFQWRTPPVVSACIAADQARSSLSRDQTPSPPRPGHPQLRIGVPAGNTLRNIAMRLVFGFTTTGCCAACSSGRSALLSE
jgi:hypothetical protein